MTVSADSSLKGQNWHIVPARVDETLSDAIKSTHDRALALEQLIQLGKLADCDKSSWQGGLEDSLGQLHELRALADRAERTVITVDDALSGIEDEFRSWLSNGEQVRARLALWLNADNQTQCDSIDPAAKEPPAIMA